MEWQPIETAPRDGTPVLIYAAGGDHHAGVLIAFYEGQDATGDYWIVRDDGDRLWATNPTHWMSLPEAPLTTPDPA